MKPKTPFRLHSARAASLVCGALFTHFAAPAAVAVTSSYYWDNDGITAGFGTAAGTWAATTTGDSTQGWSTSTTGGAIPSSVTTATGDALNFGNGATGLAAGTVAVGTVSAGNITFASGSGAIALSGGTITLAAAETITVNNAADSISAALAGAATSLTKAGAGTLNLSGSNIYSGPTTVTGGTLTATAPGALPNYSSAAKVIFSGGTVGLQVGGSGWTTTQVDTLLANATKTSGALGIDTTNGDLTQWTAFTTGNLGPLGLTKLGAGTLTLNQANTYTGTTTINQGTLDLGGFSPTTGGLAMSGATGTATGSVTNGSLTVTGGNLLVQPVGGAAVTSTLDLAGLASFTYNNSSGNIQLGGTAVNAIQGGNLKLSTTTNAITANSVVVGYQAATSPSVHTATLTLGASNTIYTTTLSVGGVQRANGSVAFATGLSVPGGPTLTLRGIAGGLTPATINITNNTAGLNAASSSMDLRGGTVDILADNLTLGSYTPSSGSANTTGSLLFTPGTINVATAIVLSKRSGASAGGTTTGRITQGGGTMKVPTLTLGDNAATLTSGTATTTAEYILGGGSLYATTIQAGTNTIDGAASARTITFNAGTIHNYDATTDLTINGVASGNGPLGIVLASTGTHTFSVDTLRTITVYPNVVISGAGGTLVKAGTGTLVLATPGNSYDGGTTLSGGILQANASGTLGSGAVALTGGGVRLGLGDGVTLANNITISSATGTAGQGLIEGPAGAAGSATLTGPIAISSALTGGGHFANRSTSGTGTFNIQGAITSSVAVVHRTGTVTYSGGGSYADFQVTGTAALGAANGLAANAVVTLGASAAGTLDLAGYSQTLAGIAKGANAATIGNSSTTADALLTTTGTSTYAGVIKDALGAGTRKLALTVSGGTLTLAGANTYTGATIVSAGTLALAAGSEASPVTVHSAAALGFTVGSPVTSTSSLTLDTGAKINITGAPSSPASYTLITAAGGIAGMPVLETSIAGYSLALESGNTVLKLNYTGGAADYASWASAHSIAGEPAAGDFDHDGLGNAAENVLGSNPALANTGLTAVSATAGVFKFRHSQSNTIAPDVTKSYQWSTDLAEWKASGLSNAGGTSATITEATLIDNAAPDNDLIEVTITVTGGPATKVFGRLIATQAP